MSVRNNRVFTSDFGFEGFEWRLTSTSWGPGYLDLVFAGDDKTIQYWISTDSDANLEDGSTNLDFLNKLVEELTKARDLYVAQVEAFEASKARD